MTRHWTLLNIFIGIQCNNPERAVVMATYMYLGSILPFLIRRWFCEWDRCLLWTLVHTCGLSGQWCHNLTVLIPVSSLHTTQIYDTQRTYYQCKTLLMFHLGILLTFCCSRVSASNGSDCKLHKSTQLNKS